MGSTLCPVRKVLVGAVPNWWTVGFDDLHSLLDERLLVEQARVDPGAFALLFRAHVVKVHAVAHRCTGSYDGAEAVTAAVFERAWRALPSFGWSGADLAGWLVRITANELRSHHRRRPPVHTAAVDGLLEQLAADLRDDVDLRVFVELDAHERDEALVRRALAALDAADHDVLVVRYLSGLSTRAAAAALGCSRATLDVATVRAMLALRRALVVEAGLPGTSHPARPAARRGLAMVITAAVSVPRAVFVDDLQSRLAALIRAAAASDVLPEVELAISPAASPVRKARVVTTAMAVTIVLALVAAVATFVPSRPAGSRNSHATSASALPPRVERAPAPLRLDVTRSPQGVRVAWARYDGYDFDAYLVLRSDRPARRISDRRTVTFLDREVPPAGVTYAVVVVRRDGAVVAMSEAL